MIEKPRFASQERDDANDELNYGLDAAELSGWDDTQKPQQHDHQAPTEEGGDCYGVAPSMLVVTVASSRSISTTQSRKRWRGWKKESLSAGDSYMISELPSKHKMIHYRQRRRSNHSRARQGQRQDSGRAARARGRKSSSIVRMIRITNTCKKIEQPT